MSHIKVIAIAFLWATSLAAQFTPYGVSCGPTHCPCIIPPCFGGGGSLDVPAPMLRAVSAAPRRGHPMTLEVVPTGPHQCVLATNFMRLAIAFAPANYTLPIEITNTRVCAVYVGSPFLVLDMQYAMTWAITLFIPNIQELVGLTLYLQAFHEYPDVQVFDAILSSNGLAATIIN